MAGSAIRTELTCVLIIGGVTGKAVRRRTFEYAICVTGRTLNIHMTTAQGESSIVMIERNFLPTAGIVTCSAICAKLTCVLIIVGMAGVAIFRRALQDSIYMTSCAGNTRVAAS